MTCFQPETLLTYNILLYISRAAESRFTGEFNIGAGDHNCLSCRSYFRQNVGLNFATTVTTAGCIPVSDTVLGQHFGGNF